jgi:hypothetical protein
MSEIERKTQPKISLGVSVFKKLLLESDIVVDKSLLIREILEVVGEAILIIRPRR